MAFLVRHRKALLAVGLGLVAWIGACAWMIRGAGQALEAGRDELDAARRGATPASLLDPATDERLARARSHFDDAAGRLGNPVLLPVRIVPVVGRHLRSAERVVDGTDQATAVAQDGIARLAELTRQPVGMGTERLAALDELAELMVDTRQSMAAVHPGSPSALIDPLA